ncbi:hypothetical protein CVT26_015175 [Gymnopilus dilepis]|uniref:V-ATPase proteolipid subunit C-like domain-containing protein n=1 Tax=Gymnopilus dilepis TaxID=231916 RepID=A0A409W9Z0_9AGAR|nr:hypothetical protein CVT26_015175 [Gymnopilus dilepis]
MPLAQGFTQLGAGLAVGLAGLAAGFAVGIVGDAGVRGTAQQPRLFVGMILILIFAEVLGLYGLIVALIMNTKAQTMTSWRTARSSQLGAERRREWRVEGVGTARSIPDNSFSPSLRTTPHLVTSSQFVCKWTLSIQKVISLIAYLFSSSILL